MIKSVMILTRLILIESQPKKIVVEVVVVIGVGVVVVDYADDAVFDFVLSQKPNFKTWSKSDVRFVVLVVVVAIPVVDPRNIPLKFG